MDEKTRMLTKKKRLPLWPLFALLAAMFSTPGAALADIGIDGNRTISSGTVTLNRYAEVTAIVGNTISVADITTLDDTIDDHYTNDTLSPGDLILIYQAQGADFLDSGDAATYGEFDYVGAGQYEFALVTGVTGNDITVEGASSPPYVCVGITNTYDTVFGSVQVVRVPQYGNLTIQNPAIVTATPWDGVTGGIVALHVQHNLVNNGTIDVSGRGFRGGAPYLINNLGGWLVSYYRGFDPSWAGEKGESILGNQDVYNTNNGRYGRGAPANGGGGGNAHNSGGGGGANGHNGGTWNEGHGFVDSNDVYAGAWDLDDNANDAGVVPSYFQNGAGGGRGGYTFSDAYQDPFLVLPGSILWRDVFGEYRRQAGGLGGRSLDNNPNVRLFFGGGGGGGDGNNGAPSGGGDGGGLVILVADHLLGTGSIVADGEDAADTAPIHDDGAGGGGGGGAIVIKSAVLSNGTLTLSARGGNGGNQPQVTGYPQEAMGPGGGGGGGYIAVASGGGNLAAAAVDGGANGVTGSDAMTTFPPNGATQGYPGGTSLSFSNANSIVFPGCQAPTAITLQGMAATAIHNNLVVVGLFLTALTLTLFALVRRSRPGRLDHH